jgi:hypothetical protein
MRKKKIRISPASIDRSKFFRKFPVNPLSVKLDNFNATRSSESKEVAFRADAAFAKARGCPSFSRSCSRSTRPCRNGAKCAIRIPAN